MILLSLDTREATTGINVPVSQYRQFRSVWPNGLVLLCRVISCGICKTEVDVSLCFLSLLLAAIEPETLQAAMSLCLHCVLSTTETQSCCYLTCGVDFRVLLISSKPSHSTAEKQPRNLVARILFCRI